MKAVFNSSRVHICFLFSVPLLKIVNATSERFRVFCLGTVMCEAVSAFGVLLTGEGDRWKQVITVECDRC